MINFTEKVLRNPSLSMAQKELSLAASCMKLGIAEIGSRYCWGPRSIAGAEIPIPSQ